MRYVTPPTQSAEVKPCHPALRQFHITPVTGKLYVITPIFNPVRYASRYRLWWAFEKHMRDSGASLYTIELAMRDRHHELKHEHHAMCNCGCHGERPEAVHIPLRTESELWFKENAMNVAVSYLPEDWEYVAFIDADFTFLRPDWVNETIHLLQHYDVIQMYTSLAYLDNEQAPCNLIETFMKLHTSQRALPKTYGHRGAVGGAWAWRRSAFEKVGGLLESCILGSGDWHMAFALALRNDVHPEMKFKEIPGYVRAINQWRERAAALKGNVGVMNCHCVHHWHGAIKNRGYIDRIQVLKRNAFDPYEDLIKDHQGLWRLRGNKPQLRDDIRAYFRQRNEDQPGETLPR